MNSFTEEKSTDRRRAREGFEKSSAHESLGALSNSDLKTPEAESGAISGASRSGAESFSAGGLSPMSRSGLSGYGAPIQAKKPQEELSEAQKKEQGKAYMEEYRPLSQRADHQKATQKMMAGLDPERLQEIEGKVDNMGYRFEELKQGDDKTALYEFMSKVTGLIQMGAGYGDFKGKDIYSRDIFTDSLGALMTDETFASKGYLDYINSQFNESGDSQMERYKQAKSLSGDEKHSQLMKLRADPEFYKFIMNSSTLSGTGMFEGGTFHRSLESNVSPNVEYMNSMFDIYHLAWDSHTPINEDEREDIEKGSSYIDNDYNSLVAPLEQMPQLPEGVMNYRTGYETQGTPLQREEPQEPPRKKHRFRRWLNK